MNWQALLLVSILLTSSKNLLHRTIMRKESSDAYAQTVLFLGLAGFFSLIISLFRGFELPQIPLLLPNFILLIILVISATLFTFKALKLISASEVGLFITSQWLWVVLGSFIFLKETITYQKILGTVLILTGLTIVRLKDKKISLNKGIIFVLIAAFLYGLSYVNAFYILRNLDAFSFEVYATLLPASILLFIRPQTIKKMKFYFDTRNLANVLVTSIFDTLAVLSLYFAYQVGKNASEIAPLSASSIILTIILGAVFLKERNNLINQFIGAILVIGGIILILNIF